MSIRELARRLFRKAAHRCAPLRELPNRVKLTVTSLEDRTVPAAALTIEALGDVLDVLRPEIWARW